MIDDDAGPAELGGEVTLQDELNLLRLQIRQTTEAWAKLPLMIQELRTACPHQEVIEWLGDSNHHRYRLCTFCGTREKDRWFATSTQNQFTGELRNVKPTKVSRGFAMKVEAQPWIDHKLPVSTNSP